MRARGDTWKKHEPGRAITTWRTNMQERESFLVRVWLNDNGDLSPLYGEVQHVRTGQRRRFRGEQELLDLLHAWTRLAQEEREEWATQMPEVDEEDTTWSPF